MQINLELGRSGTPTRQILIRLGAVMRKGMSKEEYLQEHATLLLAYARCTKGKAQSRLIESAELLKLSAYEAASDRAQEEQA